MAEMIDVDYLKILKDSVRGWDKKTLRSEYLVLIDRVEYVARQLIAISHQPEWVVSGALEAALHRALARERVLRQRNDEYRDLLARHVILGTASEDEVGTLLLGRDLQL